MLKQMIEWRRLAAHAHCRIKAWKLSERDAWTLADEVRHTIFHRQSAWEVVQRMKAGAVRVLGAQVIVR